MVSVSVLIEKAITNQVVSFSTDTLPALAVKPSYSQLIFELKQRSYEKPLILMTSSIEEIWQYVKGTSEELKTWQNMANKYLPGGLTMVLPASSLIPVTMNPLNPNSIGVRVPANAIAQEILKKTGGLATTSANLSGEEALTKMSEIAQKFPSVYVLDDDNQQNSKVASTVIKWTGNNWQTLRQGNIKIDN
ncbi:MAG: L-threonylcarbamoyladenylate synthase [Cyanobacteria bacterium]|nr:L-threonylcarbamoyladenylate synthase [Cyanobacteria bacterium CG_2015-16_32_12]NCO77513.1 L-threonylcarbamoyladenylate synthase [Cyanobacteria bacterium CG_2015-22_32_23]NCQ04193.1 L-threonylcarbamoyladenylate synthase [Cyanobacteria bacterium CG_2015-09_32_10]NCQ41742.1 L-threonylcarbamoyladenylate synthase [Cyanobacteria bacterium CG_2015-04_32_10]NCS84205.1 L-threonylcarbamoyladenylate synthase [Cyanobacteria bacterium CG_2015-02_32_10]